MCDIAIWIGENLDLIPAIAVAVATVFVARFTAKLTNSTDKLSDLAERQANLTSQQNETIEKQKEIARLQFLATHRPQVLVHTCLATRNAANAIGAEFLIVSAGTMEATIDEVAVEILLTQELRPRRELDAIDAMGIQVESGEQVWWSVSSSIVDSAIAELNKPGVEPGLWLVGRISYADGRGRMRETGFCRFYNRVADTWDRVENSDFNYSY